MERSWDPYYKYFKEFEFNLFEIFIFLEFQQEIIDLGYIGQSQINQNVLKSWPILCCRWINKDSS